MEPTEAAGFRLGLLVRGFLRRCPGAEPAQRRGLRYTYSLISKSHLEEKLCTQRICHSDVSLTDLALGRLRSASGASEPPVRCARDTAAHTAGTHTTV